ncbi:MAG: hypothetical protein ABIB79_04700 [archaeon]
MAKAKKVNKPVGILIFGIAEIVFSVISVLLFISGLFLMLALTGIADAEGMGELNQIFFQEYIGMTIGLYIISLGISISSFIGAIGLLKSREGGRKILIIAAIASISIDVISSIMEFIPGTSSIVPGMGIMMAFSITIGLIPIAYNGVLIWYLNKKNVKEYFQIMKQK